MTKLTVFISQVSDGSMYNRHDLSDPDIIHNREVALAAHDMQLDQATLLDPGVLKRDKEIGETNWCRYRELTSADKGIGAYGPMPFAVDALITRDNGHVLISPVADCIGTVFYDEAHHVLMMSHLGRHSLEQQGAIRCVKYLANEYGSKPQDIKVWMTPSISKDVFPVWALDNKGMKEIIFEQLAAAGIRSENITDNPAETDKDPNYFSYSEFLQKRRDIDGDHMIVAMMSD